MRAPRVAKPSSSPSARSATRDPRQSAPAQAQWLHGAIGNRAMVRLLAPRAAAGRRLQRDPRRPQPDPVKLPKTRPKDSSPKLPPFVPADLVRELERDNETWTLTVDGFPDSDTHSPETDGGGLGGYIWPSGVPSGVTIRQKVAVTEPIVRGWFVIEGLTPSGVKTMEPSFARLFAAHGLRDEPEPTGELQDARAAFRDRHEGHG